MKSLPTAISKLFAAIEARDLCAAKQALNLGADPNATAFGFSVIQEAAMSSCWDIVTLLIARGANPDQREGEGSQTALFCAISDQNSSALTMLLHAGASPNLTEWASGDETSALQHAAEIGNTDILRHLLEAGANVSQCYGEWECSPLHCAVLADQPEAAALLLKFGANPDAPDIQGRTPRELADSPLRRERAHLVKLFASHPKNR